MDGPSPYPPPVACNWFLRLVELLFKPGAGITIMAKFRCLQCGREVKPVIMEPATKVCPKCGSVRLEKMKK